jgi:proline iminopeptidase
LHTAGASIAVHYAVRYRPRIGRLALITPIGGRSALEPEAGMRREIAKLGQGRPWFAAV